jgi:hypothetical protein
MTETDWLTCTQPQPLLDYIRGRASERKLRLLARAFAAQYVHLGEPESYNRHSVSIAEAAADGRVTRDELERFYESVVDDLFSGYANMAGVAHPDVQAALDRTCAAAEYYLSTDAADPTPPGVSLLPAVHARLADLVREVFGNPLRPLPPPTAAVLAWNGGTVPALARAIYDDWAFARLPVLADALEEAGYTDAAVLEHCRGSGPHTKGCWAVDLVLGKE